MKKVRWIAYVFLLSLALLLVGCVPSKEKGTEDNKKNSSDADAPLEISIFTPKISDENFEDNEFTKRVEKELNIKINWEYANRDASQEKYQLSLASGDYPDAYLLVDWVNKISKVDAQKYGGDGVFLTLNDLIKEHAPNIQKAIDGDIPYLAEGITAPDGNIYALPFVNECFHCSIPGKMWINTEWLDTLNLEMPTTTEEFKKVLTAFKNDDPNGNGKKDEIPLSGKITDKGGNPVQFLMNAFLPNDGEGYINVNDGKLVLAPMQPEWKDGLSYIHTLYNEGLIDVAAFTHNEESLKQLGTTEGDTVLGSVAAGHIAPIVDLASDKAKDYDVVPPLKGPDGAQFTTSDYGGVTGFTFAITKKAEGEKAEALVKLANLLFSEEGGFIAKGKEGVHWKKGGADDIDLNGQPAKFVTIPKKDPDEVRESYGWGERGPLLLSRELRDSQGVPEDELLREGYERRLFNATKKYEGFEPEEQFIAPRAWVSPEESEELGLLRVNIVNYIEENTVQFVTGAKNIEKDWDSYIKGFEKLKVDRYLEIYQKAYDGAK